MDLLGLDIANVLIGAASGFLGSVLTYLATRRQHQISERSVYISAVENLTASLRSEIERVNMDRRDMRATIEALEQHIAEREERERKRLLRIARGRNGEPPDARTKPDEPNDPTRSG